MSKKKEQKVVVSQEDEAQAQAAIEQYHTLAKALRSSTDQKQTEEVLSPVTGLSEGAQMALLKALSNERHIDAADILSAINVLSPIKSIRKEARRSLIRLEQVRIYPQWEPALERISPIEAIQSAMNSEESVNPPRFWKGVLSDTRDVGEVQMMLLWEQGKDYKDVRVLGFLLELWHDGIKDFFTRLESKRSVDQLLESLEAEEKLIDCSLAKGRRLIEEALAVNKKYGTPVHKDFRLSISLVNKLVLENPDIVDEEEDEEFDDEEFDDEEEEEEAVEISPDLTPIEVVTSFVEAWVDKEYEEAYQYLSSDSKLREGLTEEEWVARREEWAEDAQPDKLKPNFIREREARKSGIWLPNPFSKGTAQTEKEIDAGWSIELADTVEKGTLPELPEATVVYEETGRHWFWASYKLVDGPGGWRIQNMVDEGTNAQSLQAAELRRRIDQHYQRNLEITKKHKPTDPDALDYLNEVLWRALEILYYDDALIAQDPLDEKAYIDAVSRATLVHDEERTLVYLEGVARYFPGQQAEALRQIGTLQLNLSEHYYEEEDDEREEHFQELAEATLRKSLTIEDSLDAHMLLAEVLQDMGDDDKLDEAEEQLHQAQALSPDQSHLAIIENQLGDIKLDREEYEKALSHFQRALEIDPGYVNAWRNIGNANEMLGNKEEAIASFRRAIELEPNTISGYIELSGVYAKAHDLPKARAVLEEGIKANPDTTQLHLLLAASYVEENDFERAGEIMDEAEKIDPNDEMVQMYQQILTLSKSQQTSRSKKKKPKKR
jgi:tetratricopeptide (TPR) repeat protein